MTSSVTDQAAMDAKRKAAGTAEDATAAKEAAKVAAAQAKAQAKAEADAAKAAKKAEADAAKAAKKAEVDAAKAAKAEEKQAAAVARKEAVKAAAAEKAAEKAAAKAQRDADRAEKAVAKAKEKAAKEAERVANIMPEKNGIRRPRPGTICGKVWETADSITEEQGSPVAIKTLSAHTGVAAVNDATLKTQYARWREFNGIYGRVAPPADPEASTGVPTDKAA